ncbi:MAG: hypothetical protein V1688_02990 [bacterium]
MSNNNQQLNNDDFSEFDFDDGDILVKDGEQENTETPMFVRQLTDQGRLQHKNTKTQKHENKIIGSGYINHPTNVLILKQQLGAPLDLKKAQAPLGETENIQENLVKQANMQKEKIKALEREGDGLVYDEKDEEEIERFKNNPLAKSGFNIDLLTRKLMGQLNIVSTLKIDLISRLKNIIDSFLRDIRGAQATEDLLQRSLDRGGLNLTQEHTRQIMDFIKNEYKKIHSAVIIETRKHENTHVRPSADGSGQAATQKQKNNETRNQEVKNDVADDMQAVSKKTAREAQVGVFSDEIVNSYKRDNFKPQFSASGKKDLAQWEKGLAVPGNLRTPEISAPKNIKKLTTGTVAPEASKTEPPKPKIEEQKNSTKSGVLFQDFGREEALESLNEEFAQDEIKIENQEKKKTSWISMLFGLKTRKHGNNETPIRQAQGRLQHENTKTIGRKSEVGKVPSSNPPAGGQVPSVKEIPYQQAVVRRAVGDKPNFDNRRKMEDVKVVHPHLVGPIEELSEMTVLDFRRLGSTAQDSIDKIKEKIEISGKESFNKKIAAINGWKKSQPNQLYIELGRQSLSQKIPVENLISQYYLENKPVLTKQEFDVISQLNKELRY